MKKHNKQSKNNATRRQATKSQCTTIPIQGLRLDCALPDTADGSTMRLHQLTQHSGLLTGITLTPTLRLDHAAGYRVAGEHRTEHYHHLLLERTDSGGNHYAWTDARDPDDIPHPILLPHAEVKMNCLTAVGDILCLVTDSDTLYAVWQTEAADYAVATLNQLGYDLLIGQDQQQHVYVSQPVDSRLRGYLAAPESPLRSKPTVASGLFGESGDQAESFATNATLIRAAAESALDQTIAASGASLFKHIVFGVTALRLFDGSHVHYSPIFALLPAEVSDTVNYDGERIGMWTWLHRHTLSITMRHPTVPASTLVQGIDVYLSQPVTFTALHTPSAVTRNGEGRVTSLTFPYLDLAHTEALYRSLTFRHALRIASTDFGSELLLQQAPTQSAEIDMSDRGMLRFGARHAFVYGHRLHLTDVTPTLGHPFSVRLRYRYATLSHSERLNGTVERAGEWIAGERPDVSDQPLGTTALLAVVAKTDGAQQQRVVFSGEVAYPLPGALQMGNHHITWMEVHLRVVTDGTARCFVRRTSTESIPGRDIADAAYVTTGGAHRTSRPAFHSLLLQEVRALAYDSGTATYGWSHDLWTEESEADFQDVYTQARSEWPLERRPSALMWSAEDNPLLMGESAATEIGGGCIRGVAPCTRRTASNLIGEYPLYAFTDEGIWVLRLESGFRWQARQPISAEVMLVGGGAVSTGESVVFLSRRGVMELKGNRLSCLSEALGPRTEGFWSGRQLLFDAVGRHLLLMPGSADDGTAWLYQMDSGCWSTIVAGVRWLQEIGGEWWGVGDGSDGDDSAGCLDGECSFSSLSASSYRGDGEGGDSAPVCMELKAAAVEYHITTRPFTLGDGCRLHSLLRTCLKGSPVAQNAALLRIEGSNDGACWHCIAWGERGRVGGFFGSGYRWFRIHIAGCLQEGESLAGIGLEYVERAFC